MLLRILRNTFIFFFFIFIFFFFWQILLLRACWVWNVAPGTRRRTSTQNRAQPYYICFPGHGKTATKDLQRWPAGPQSPSIFVPYDARLSSVVSVKQRLIPTCSATPLLHSYLTAMTYSQRTDILSRY